MTPKKMAHDFACQIYALAEKEANNGMLPAKSDIAALILSAAAKMVQQSGAVAALESCGEAIYRGDTYQHFDEQKVHAALQSLRSISEGSSGRPNRSIPSPLGGQIGGEPRGSPPRNKSAVSEDLGLHSL